MDKLGPWPDTSDPLVSRDILGRCWRWIGAVTSQGYGTITEDHKQLLAHRVSLTLHGRIAGEQTDHLCRYPLCVNPDHLESVTIRENTRRGAGKAAWALRENLCKYRHEFDKTRGGRWRGCKTCQMWATRIYRARLRDAKLNEQELEYLKKEVFNDC